MQLSGKTALITGATTGIGRAAAELFIAQGVKSLIITGQNADRLEHTRAALSQSGTPVTAIQWRADQVADSAALAERVRAEHGALDIVFANAGVTWPAGLGDIDAQAAQDQFMINVTGPLILLQALAPLIAEGGSIIATTSCLDVLGMPGMAVYSATKAAMRSVVRTLSVELADKNIRVNAIAPGPIETPIYSKLGMSEDQLAEMAAGIVAQVPAGRFGKPEEIAAAAAFLGSDASSYMRGAELTIDGGWSNL